jgi:hypothetical protein
MDLGPKDELLNRTESLTTSIFEEMQKIELLLERKSVIIN